MFSYKQIVEVFQQAAENHIAIKSFQTGPLSFLDSSSQNTRYPFIFLRPITSLGLQDNIRTLTFELYSLDVPKQSNPSPVQLLSNTEQYLYDIGAFIRRGEFQQDLNFTMDNIVPVNEAFQDRVYGWVSTVNVENQAVFDLCNYPDNTIHP
jgi:hypothetical protein